MDVTLIDDFLLGVETQEDEKKKKKKKDIKYINATDGLVERIDKKCITSCGKELLND